jgi:hypothetical protein
MFTFIKSYWQESILMVFGTIIGVLLYINNGDNDTIAQLNQQVADMGVRIEMQNLAIDEWKEKGQALINTLAIKQREAAKNKAESDKRIKALLTAKVPKNCEQAVRWGIAYIR